MHLLKLTDAQRKLLLPPGSSTLQNEVKWASQRFLNQNLNYPKFVELPLLKSGHKSQWETDSIEPQFGPHTPLLAEFCSKVLHAVVFISLKISSGGNAPLYHLK